MVAAVPAWEPGATGLPGPGRRAAGGGGRPVGRGGCRPGRLSCRAVLAVAGRRTDGAGCRVVPCGRCTLYRRNCWCPVMAAVLPEPVAVSPELDAVSLGPCAVPAEAVGAPLELVGTGWALAAVPPERVAVPPESAAASLGPVAVPVEEVGVPLELVLAVGCWRRAAGTGGCAPELLAVLWGHVRSGGRGWRAAGTGAGSVPPSGRVAGCRCWRRLGSAVGAEAGAAGLAAARWTSAALPVGPVGSCGWGLPRSCWSGWPSRQGWSACCRGRPPPSGRGPPRCRDRWSSWRSRTSRRRTGRRAAGTGGRPLDVDHGVARPGGCGVRTRGCPAGTGGCFGALGCRATGAGRSSLDVDRRVAGPGRRGVGDRRAPRLLAVPAEEAPPRRRHRLYGCRPGMSYRWKRPAWGQGRLPVRPGGSPGHRGRSPDGRGRVPGCRDGAPCRWNSGSPVGR